MMTAAVLSARGYGWPIVASVALHALLLGLVMWGWEASAPASAAVTPRVVEARLVTLKPTATRPEPQPSNTVNLAEKRRQQALLEQERQRKLAEEKRKKAAQLAKQQAAEKKAAEKKAAEKKAAEKAARDKAAQELARKEKAVAEERARQAQEARAAEQRRQEAQMAQALAQEKQRLQAEAALEQAQSYIGVIAALIEQNWSRPPSARRGMQCELSIQLIPTGEVVNVSVIKSSGNPAFDRSAEQAVKKAGRFEVLSDVPPALFEQYFRQLRLRFDPQDLRL